MEQGTEEKRESQGPKKGELLRQAAVVLCLLLGLLMKKLELTALMVCFWAAAAVFAVLWILWVRNEGKGKKEEKEE